MNMVILQRTRLRVVAEREVAKLTATELYEQHFTEVFRYVSRRVPTQEEAEDITTEVFAAAFQALPRFRGQCSPYLWLLGIARRKVADTLRKYYRRREMPVSELPSESILESLASPEEGPEAKLQHAEELQVIRNLVRQLKPDQREALLLQYVEGLTIREIGVVMRRSPAAINSLLQRARAAIYRQGQSYFLEGSEGAK